MRSQNCGTTSASSTEDRKSTRLNSSHLVISYAVFCLKKKKHVKSSHLVISYVVCNLEKNSRRTGHAGRARTAAHGWYHGHAASRHRVWFSGGRPVPTR